MTLNLEPIRARAEAASPPPESPRRWADRVFAQHARADVLALCAEVEKQRAAVRTIAAEVGLIEPNFDLVDRLADEATP